MNKTYIASRAAAIVVTLAGTVHCAAAQQRICIGPLSVDFVQTLAGEIAPAEIADSRRHPDRSTSDIVASFRGRMLAQARERNFPQRISAAIAAMQAADVERCFRSVTPALAAASKVDAAVVAKRREVRLQAEAEETRKREEKLREARSPPRVLARAYAAYVLVKRCRESREGYRLIYISDTELERARKAIAVIETKIKNENAGLETEPLWKSGNEIADKLDVSRGACQSGLSLLEGGARKLAPGSLSTEKDF
jgi:hypothetical protein